MKRLFLSVLIFSMTFGISWSQIQVGLDTISMSQGVQVGYTVDLENTNADDLSKTWKKYIKTYKGKKAKFDKNTNEYFSDNLKIKAMSNNTVDVYAIFAPIQGGTRVIVLYDLGGAFLTPAKHGGAAKVGQQMVYDFALEIKKEQIREKIASQKQELKNMEKEMEKLAKGEQDIRKSIEELKAKIAQLEEDVTNNKNAQTEQQNKITEQKEAIQKATQQLEEIK